MIDASWIDALKLPTKVVTGLFIASVVLLIFDRYEILALSTFGAIAKPITVLVCVVAGALSLTSIIAFFIELFTAHRKRSLLEHGRQLKKAEKEKQFEAKKQRVLERINHLSKDELDYLADCLRNNSQSFNTYVHSPQASTLMAKGLIYTPGGTHHQDHYPFVINDFVWRHLLDIKDEIIARDEENKRIEAEERRSRRRRRN